MMRLIKLSTYLMETLMSLNRPCDDALKGMPGDRIRVLGGNGWDAGWHTIANMGWLPSHNGGKIWTYFTDENVAIPNDVVIQLERARGKDKDEAKVQIANLMEKMQLSTSLKAAVGSILCQDEKSLESAIFFIQTRIKELNELKLASSSNKASEAHPIKEGI